MAKNLSSVRNFLIKGRFLAKTESGDTKLCQNGLKLKANIENELCKSLRTTEKCHLLEGTTSLSDNLMDSKVENGLSVRQVFSKWMDEKCTNQLSFLQKPSESDIWTSYTLLPNWSKTSSFSYQDFLRSRRRFWKGLIFDPGSELKVTEHDTRGPSPRAFVETNFENGLPNLELENLGILSTETPEEVKIVQTKSNLRNATLTVLMSSVRKRLFLDTERLALPMHLSIYHLTIFPSVQNNEILNQFVHFIKLLLEDEGLLVWKSVNSKNLDEVYQESDFLGTPYVVVVPERSLENGVLLMRDRETCIFEHVHCALLTQKLAKIFLDKDVRNTWEIISERKDLVKSSKLKQGGLKTKNTKITSTSGAR